MSLVNVILIKSVLYLDRIFTKYINNDKYIFLVVVRIMHVIVLNSEGRCTHTPDLYTNNIYIYIYMCFSVVIKTIFFSTNYDMIFAKGSRGAIKRFNKILPTPFAKFNQTKNKFKKTWSMNLHSFAKIKETSVEKTRKNSVIFLFHHTDSDFEMLMTYGSIPFCINTFF